MLSYPHDLIAPPRMRGERNNNPLNMDRGTPPIPWEGLASPADQQQEPRFAVFTDPEHGIRAGIVNMRTHAARGPGHRITLEALISIWAPPIENNTQAYIEHVALQMGLASGSVVDLGDPACVAALVKAIITHENGRCIYPDALIGRAMWLLNGWHPATTVASA